MTLIEVKNDTVTVHNGTCLNNLILVLILPSKVILRINQKKIV